MFSTFHCLILFDLLFCRHLLLIINYHFFLSNYFFSCAEVSIWLFYVHWFSKVKQILRVRNKLNLLTMYEPFAMLLDPTHVQVCLQSLPATLWALLFNSVTIRGCSLHNFNYFNFFDLFYVLKCILSWWTSYVNLKIIYICILFNFHCFYYGEFQEYTK